MTELLNIAYEKGILAQLTSKDYESIENMREAIKVISLVNGSFVNSCADYFNGPDSVKERLRDA